jgi:defect-in-organelle-trafficking protein DotB
MAGADAVMDTPVADVSPMQAQVEALGADAPPRIDKDYLDLFLTRAAELGVNDICFQTGSPIQVAIHSSTYYATRRSIGTNELENILTDMYHEQGRAMIAGGEDIDYSYRIKLSRTKYLSFRANASAGLVEEGDGIQISLRPIPSEPGELAKMNVAPEILRGMFPDQGLVLVVGTTGSGKTTLLAAVLRHRLETMTGEKLITVEAPIEFLHTTYKWRPGNLCMQSEVGRHTKSFAAFTRGSLRRMPRTMLVGEMRDQETFRAGLTAGLSGTCVYGTAHAKGVSETIGRILSEFDASEQMARCSDLLQAVKLILVQRLVPSLDGRRVPLREYLVFDDHVKNELSTAAAQSIDKLILRTRELVEERGESLLASVKRYVDEDRVDPALLGTLSMEMKGA